MADCAAAGPKAVASRTPGHGSGPRGGPKRSGPRGGKAKGTPRKTARGPSVVPLSRPEASSTVGAMVGGTYRPGGSESGRDTAPSSAGDSLGEDQEAPI